MHAHAPHEGGMCRRVKHMIGHFVRRDSVGERSRRGSTQLVRRRFAHDMARSVARALFIQSLVVQRPHGQLGEDRMPCIA